jgi:tripartite-type tricarboxylate transporter receptor subunit TctC
MGKKVLLMMALFAVLMCYSFGTELVWAAYPDKRIQLIISFAPGGMADSTGRLLAHHVNPFLGGRVYVENILGAGGAPGFRAGAKASPDGYTITLLLTAQLTGPYTMKDYPSIDLFDPICIAVQDPIALTVKPDSRFKTITDLVAHAKTHPGEVTIGHSGVGSLNHMADEAFADAAKVKLSLVPFKGASEALVAAMGGHVDIASSGSGDASVYSQGGKLRPLIVFGYERSRHFPAVPTAKELGYDVVISQWVGVGIAKGTPEEVKATLIEAFKKAMENEEYKKSVDKMGIERISLGPKEAVPWLKAQSDFFRNLAQKIGLKPE